MVPNVFGVFMIASSLIYYVSLQMDLRFTLVIIGLKGITILLCSTLISKSIWSESAKPYYHLFYFVCVFFCVPFVGMLSSLSDPSSVFTTINIVL